MENLPSPLEFKNHRSFDLSTCYENDENSSITGAGYGFRGDVRIRRVWQDELGEFHDKTAEFYHLWEE